MSDLKTCSRCRERPASTEHAAYCKSCRAEYQREWRRRRLQKSEVACETAAPVASTAPRLRLRGTPTRAEMVRYRLI
ncbi:hypothetical protein HNP73_003376 [Amaricoccus macauensis]|uniref:Uncharacterized protein n=1 Tax=Amaricoccus macauensis TaxID=57001 RepID=A0A840SJX4_9RHOB|nr:hypothetical protein [Amaricoccus macauensis]MBB5223429.1 hypothetical protein [Amaricoccus macauensis]